MKRVFKGISIDECIKEASELLDIPIDDIVYEIEEKKSFFKKEYTISIEVPEVSILKDMDGTIRIEEGKVIIKNPKEGGKPAKILPSKFVNTLLDGELINRPVEVYESSSISFSFLENQASRKLDINISPDKMSAYIKITYASKKVFSMKNTILVHELEPECNIVEEISPSKYNIEEIKEELKKMNVVYGIIEENIKEYVQKNGVGSILVAKGQEKIDEVDDFIDYKFDIDKDMKEFVEDNEGNVDFKSIGSITAVSRGDIIAIRCPSDIGKDGIDINGNVLKYKIGKKIKLKVSNGCLLKDENTVIAEIDGKPCIKNGVFYIFKIHEIPQDIDLTTGNIRFSGDIIIHGNVREGMKVEAGNSIEIDKDIERSEIIGKGDITVKGNVISSKITGGGEDVVKLNRIQYLSELLESLKSMIENIEEIKKFNLLGYDITDGNIIKVLIESKFKNLPKLYLNIVKDAAIYKENPTKKLSEILREKLIGLAPLSIKHYSELDEILKQVENDLIQTKMTLSLPVNIKIGYCQDSTISSSGDIIFNGKGVYITKANANNNILFTEENCIVRGGYLKASNEIRCKIVGSDGGVATKLIVDNEGSIWIDVAYENTILAVGVREFVIDCYSKNVHAFIDTDHELIVNRTKQ